MTKERRNLFTGLAFLTPNILGVMVFVIFPVVFSLYMAFTNWDLTLHNMFKEDASVQWVGLGNFVELVSGDRFMRYLGNTLFFMMAIPFSVAGSLAAAMMLSQDTRAGGGRAYAWLIAGGLLIVSVALLAALGMGATAMTLLLVGTACSILLMGLFGGLTFYRTLFYTPHFVAGVATFILWKKLYSKETGPINMAIQPVLNVVNDGVNTLPAGLFGALFWVGLILMVLVFLAGVRRLRLMTADGDMGYAAAGTSLGLLMLPLVLAAIWSPTRAAGWPILVGGGAVVAYHLVRLMRTRERFAAPLGEGFGTGLMLALMLMVAEFVLLGLSPVIGSLPAMADAARGGMTPPSWLNDPSWAKPALMIMGFWAAIGSNNMLLYLAALTNVPGELYEAADIDGASRPQRFWHITWPQLAPTTFFILVMSTIGGLQGGFEMARVMTQGGPAGATTTLSYFIFQEGFETGRLGFASAVAWALFVLIFLVTVFNWNFGNRYVND